MGGERRVGAGERVRRLAELKLRHPLQRHQLLHQWGPGLAAGGLSASITQHSLLPAGLRTLNKAFFHEGLTQNKQSGPDLINTLSVSRNLYPVRKNHPLVTVSTLAKLVLFFGVCVFCVVADREGLRENDWLVHCWGIAHKCLSEGEGGAYYHTHTCYMALAQ